MEAPKIATIRDFGIPGVGNGILQPKLKNRWRVIFAGLGNTNGLDISMQAVSAKRPQIAFSEVNLFRYNSRAWIAGKHEWQPTEIVVEDDVTSRATQQIQQQITLQQLLVGAGPGPFLAAAPEGSLYKFASIIDMLDGNQTVLESWTLEGCWFVDIAYGDLTYRDATDAVSITLKVRFDHAYQTIQNYTTGQGSALGGDGVNFGGR